MSSLSTRARVAGFLYIVSSAVGFLRLISISNKLIASGDATATADNIAAHESLFRWGMFSYLIAGVLFLCVTFALYRLPGHCHGHPRRRCLHDDLRRGIR